MLGELGKQEGIIIGDNEPYNGALGNDTMYTHCTRRGLAHGILEVRQDLICHKAGIDEWVARIAKALEPVLARLWMHEIRYNGTRTGPVENIQQFEGIRREKH